MTQHAVKHRDRRVQHDVGQMVRGRLQLGEGVIPPEGEDSERPVRLVAPLLGHGGPPEVVAEDIAPVDMRPEITVLLDGRDVVEDEIAPEGVPVDGCRQQEQKAQARLWCE